MSEELKITDKRHTETMPAPVSLTPATLLQMAVAQGANLEKLEKLMELQMKWEANEARKAYTVAMGQFKADPPKINKNKHVKFEKKAGGFTEYDHATLDNVVDLIGSALSKCGITHTWRTEQSEGKIRVTCILTHVLGHSESTALVASSDDSGGKNSIQAIGSTVSYLERYTLLAATGLATADQDKDGKIEEVERITPNQVADLDALLDELKVNRDKFFRWAKVEKLEDIAADAYVHVVKEVESKRKGTGSL